MFKTKAKLKTKEGYIFCVKDRFDRSLLVRCANAIDENSCAESIAKDRNMEIRAYFFPSDLAKKIFGVARFDIEEFKNGEDDVTAVTNCSEVPEKSKNKVRCFSEIKWGEIADLSEFTF